MNRRQNAALASWVAVATALLVIVALFFTFRSGTVNPTIVLPPEPDDLSGLNSPSEDITPSGELSLELIEITRKNAANLIADMARPSEYSSVGKTTIFSGDEKLERTHRIHVLGDYQKIEQYYGDTWHDKMVYTPDIVHLYLNGQTIPVARGDFSPDTASLMPTYEDILTLNQESVTDAKYVEYNDVPCARIEVRSGAMEICYWVNLENGLLIEANAKQNNDVAWEFKLVELTLERPNDDNFLLPSGAYPWE